MRNIIKFVALNVPKLKPFAIDKKDGNIIHVCEAALIRLITEAFGSRYEVLTPPDHSAGIMMSDGNWTGMIGMVTRSEADLAMCGIAMTEDRYGAVNFSYPTRLSQMTFIADKPVPASMKTAVFQPFASSLWIILLVLLFTVAFVYYILIDRNMKFHKVLFRTFGSLTEKEIRFKSRTTSVRMLTFFWIFGILIITNSYKAVLLSFLSVPTLTGIRDISDLSEASLGHSVACFTFRGSYMLSALLHSNDEKLRAVGKCLKFTESPSINALIDFFNSPLKKVFIGERFHISSFQLAYHLSEDTFFRDIRGIPFSSSFCCPKRLNKVISRFDAAGLLQKTRNDESLFWQLSMTYRPSEVSKAINLDDLSGAFYILIAGWIMGLVIFIAEHIKHRSKSLKRKRIFSVMS